jgi:hypothetical protein
MAPSFKHIAIPLAALLATASAHAQPSAPPADGIAGWDSFIGSLRDLAPAALAKLTPQQRQDPQIRQEVGRLLLEALAARSLDAIAADADHPQFLPSLNPTLNVFQPNSDTIYKNAKISGTGVYRVRGTRGTVRLAPLGQFGGGGPALGYIDLNSLPVDSKGQFDLLVSAERPAGATGQWWKLDPRATALMLRQVSSDWGKEQDPSITIERLDRPVSKPRPAAQDLQQRLEGLGQETSRTALAFIDHVSTLRREGYENRLKEFDVISNLGGLTGQFYYEGAYALKADEALILETKVPDKCAYYSTILTNDIFETTDWVNNHSSLNDAQSRVDADGVLRIVISATDPGVINWLDTAGYPKGVIQGRWTQCAAQPIPTLKLVKTRDVLRTLPATTARISLPEREKLMRERRSQFLLRRQW